MAANDVWVRPKDNIIGIGSSTYEYKGHSSKPLANVRAVTHVAKVGASTFIYPGEYVELQMPPEFANMELKQEIALEPRLDAPINAKQCLCAVWPKHSVLPAPKVTALESLI